MRLYPGRIAADSGTMCFAEILFRREPDARGIAGDDGAFPEGRDGGADYQIIPYLELV
jgi:hypothetical protein